METILINNCRDLIVKYCTDNPTRIYKQFWNPTEEDIVNFNQWMTSKDNWEFIDKDEMIMPEVDGFPKGTIEYVFNCIPFNDQLRAYVRLDKLELNVLDVYVVGE